MSIGQTLSNEISFSIFNDEGYLNDYGFGEFTALIGAEIGSNGYTKQGNCSVTTKYASYVGNSSYPYLTRNGAAVGGQPSFIVNTILAYDDKVYAFNGNGRYAVYDDKNGANITNENRVCTFMKYKTKNMEGIGAYYNKDSRILFVYQDGTRHRYECVPLGKFSALRPNVPNQIYIDFTCNDFMTKFDVEMPESKDMSITYPTTLGNILNRMCKYVGVENGEKNGFMNSTIEVEKEPEDFSKSTMREVLAWIAEAACANAKIDRDGKLKLKWLNSTDQSFDEHSYMAFQPYWYKTPKVDRVLNRDTSKGADDVNGAGRNGYMIQDNPFLQVKSKEPEGEQPWDKAKNGWVKDLEKDKYLDVEVTAGGGTVDVG